jgi:hypothetical protein
MTIYDYPAQLDARQRRSKRRNGRTEGWAKAPTSYGLGDRQKSD